MNEISKNKQKGRTLFLYGLSLILLIEWLLPLPFITDTGFIHLFLYYTFFCFLLTYLQLSVWVSIGCKTFAMIYGLHIMFNDGNFLSLEWFHILFADILFNISLMLTGQWVYLTDLFRSILFFILLAVMSYLLYYWAVQVKRILFFLIATVIYITIIDTFTPYDATFSIIRTFMAGFLLLGLITMYRSIDQERVASYSRILPARLLIALTVVIFCASAFGYAAPKFEPQWADPVPYMRAALGMETAGTGTIRQRIGYGDSDDRLGGGFEHDDTPVFYAYTTRGNYWRGESKNYYTGRGWEVTTPEIILDSRMMLYESRVETETMETEIYLAGDQMFPHLFYPGELSSVNVNSPFSIAVEVDAHTGKANTFYGGDPVKLSDYKLEYEFPKFSVSSLRNSSENDPPEIQEYYLQLPDDLPERVGELAETIVAGFDNRYDQAKAMERYFVRAGYRYETQEVAVPGPDEDYVDQFLFETKQGYCDNFSTSMAVLLRTLDIPTRWVKGFTQGERLDENDGIRQYLITNANAHSWVEVYFPEHGWVPFEPTSGFNHGFDFVFDSTDPNDIDWERDEDELETPEAEETLADVEEENETVIGGGGRNNFPILIGSLSVLAILLVGTLLFINKERLIVSFLLYRYRNNQEVEAFEKAFERLIWLLGHKGLPKKKAETLREYAERVDELYATNEMTILTLNYEKVSYGNASSNPIWLENRKLWENLVRKIGS